MIWPLEITGIVLIAYVALKEGHSAYRWARNRTNNPGPSNKTLLDNIKEVKTLLTSIDDKLNAIHLELARLGKSHD